MGAFYSQSEMVHEKLAWAGVGANGFRWCELLACAYNKRELLAL